MPVRCPVRLFLAALSALGLLTRVASQCANMKKDPHLSFAFGGRADFRGKHGVYYSFLSTPSLAINVRTEEAQFKTFRDALMVDGSFITELHVVALVGGEKHKLATASFWTSELNGFIISLPSPACLRSPTPTSKPLTSSHHHTPTLH